MNHGLDHKAALKHTGRSDLLAQPCFNRVLVSQRGFQASAAGRITAFVTLPSIHPPGTVLASIPNQDDP